MEKELKVRIFDIEVGRCEVTLNEEDARELGIHPKDRVTIFFDSRSATVVLNTAKTVVSGGEIGICTDLAEEYDLKSGDKVQITPAERPKSIEYIRKKMDGLALNESEFEAIVNDVVNNNLSEVEITAFISAIYINQMTVEETAYLAKKTAECGETLDLKRKPVFDKHSLGGVPGNKITLLVVPIVAAAGLTIPKTSSRAITSACGTADIMEVLAPVTFDAREIEAMVNKTNAVIVWGGGANLAPADDIFIRIEHPLAIDPHYLALASVMAKKYAVGAEFVVIDLPMGPETKVKDMKEAKKYARDFIELGEKLGIDVECAVTYGDKPIGRAVGPALEAREALATLEGEHTSTSLVEKATELAGILLEADGAARKGKGKEMALEILKSGAALKKMKEIIEVQGGDPNVTSKDIKVGNYQEKIFSDDEGYVTNISNRAVVRVARRAGAPKDQGAGILFNIRKGEKVEKGALLYEIYSNSEYKLEQAVKLTKQLKPVRLEGMLLERIPDYTVIEK
ncbi:AMP phosphorylase [archaeon]|nr:AMP phosphorylase [archaeon]